MNLSHSGLEFIISFEGYHRKLPDGSCTAYRCIIGKDANGRPIHDGKWTIGFGCTEGVTEGMVWTRQQAEEAFKKELLKHEAAVIRLVTVELNQNEFDALVSFSYNCGTGIGTDKGGLANSSILKKLNAGDRVGAARCFALYNKSRGVVVSGLIRRRSGEAAMFLRRPEPAVEPDMPQQVDPPSDKPEGSRIMATAGAGEKTAATLSIGGVLLWIINAFHLNDALGFAGQILPLVKDYGFEAFITVMLALAAGFAMVKHFRKQDHVEGKTLESPA